MLTLPDPVVLGILKVKAGIFSVTAMLFVSFIL